MKIRVKVIEEAVYELDVTEEEYCNAHAHLTNWDAFHDKVLTDGKLVDVSREWKGVTNLEPNKLEKFFRKRA